MADHRRSRHRRRYLWAASSGLLYALWEWAAWLTRTDFTHYVKDLEAVSPAWDATATWTGGGDVM